MKKYLTSLLVSLIVNSCNAHAIVIRHDIPDNKYHATADDFPPLATLYKIGVHGTLIHPQWVVTAAHAIFCMEPEDKLKVGKEWAEVKKRYAHASYQLDGENDIALIKLKKPVNSISPAKLYRLKDEMLQNTWFIGSGGTGTGDKGQTISYKENNGQLRKAENQIESVSENEIFFVFDQGDEALPLEGVSGNADSGGPAYRKINNDYYLLGISSRADSWFKNIGEYGVNEVYSRISYHSKWIDEVIKEDPVVLSRATTQNNFAQNNIKDNIDQICSKIGF